MKKEKVYNSFLLSIMYFFFFDREKYKAFKKASKSSNDEITFFEKRRDYNELLVQSDYYSYFIISQYCLVPYDKNSGKIALYKNNKLIIPSTYEGVINKILEKNKLIIS